MYIKETIRKLLAEMDELKRQCTIYEEKLGKFVSTLAAAKKELAELNRKRSRKERKKKIEKNLQKTRKNIKFESDVAVKKTVSQLGIGNLIGTIEIDCHVEDRNCAGQSTKIQDHVHITSRRWEKEHKYTQSGYQHKKGKNESGRPQASATESSIIAAPDFETIVRQLEANECKACGQTFLTEPGLRHHEQVSHLDLTTVKYNCSTCGKGFRKREQLKNHCKHHIRQLKEKLLACGFCQMRFRENKDLVNHERVHTGDRPFTCTKCKRSFARMTYLTRHVKTHHLTRISCPKCFKEFQRLESLRIHRRQCRGCGTYKTPHKDGFPPLTTI